MNLFSVGAAVLGILLGVTLTLQIYRLFSTRTSQQFGHVDHTQRLYNHTDSTPTTSTGIDGRLDKLKLEQADLLAKLHRIEIEIAKLHSTKVVTANTTAGASTAACQYDFKVYVYDIPADLNAIRISEEARRNQTLHVCHKCILEQFSLEYIMNDFFVNFCGRTRNPEEADFFYLPLVRDAEFRMMQSIGTRNRAPSTAENALLSVLEKNDTTLWRSVFSITDKYWHAHKGADHILVMPAPVTNIRHETSQRGFFHYMMHLHTPIFLCLEYSANFISEYPVCSSQKNIVVPYPTTDPELFNGKLTSAKVKREYLLYYAGGLHGDCVEVRKAMKVLMQNSTHLPGVIPPIRSNQAEREHGFLAATFCPIPIGDSPSSKRMYDVLNFGCIPVVLSDDLIWAYTDQSGGPLNHTEFSIQIPQSVVHFTARKSLARFADNQHNMGVLPSGVRIYDLLNAAYTKHGDRQNGIYVNPLVQILQSVSPKDVDLLREGVRKNAPFYRYYSMHPQMKDIPTATHVFPEGGAIQVLAHQLSVRKRAGLDKIRDSCIEEKGRKHQYISRYACDGKDKVESLVRRRVLLESSSVYKIVQT